MGQLFSIGEVAEAVGLAPSALRHYDEIGLVSPTTRVAGQRRYDADALTRLRVVNHCRRAGFTLDEVAALLDDGDQWPSLARRKRDELQERIAELVRATRLVDAALACGCDDLVGCERATGEEPAEGGWPPHASLTDPTRRLLPTAGH